VAHIADESEVAEKRGSVAPARPRAQTRIQPQRVLETMTARKDQSTRHPHDPKRNKGRGPRRPRECNRPPKHKFVMGLADLIAIPNDLVKSGFLNDYLLDRRTGGASSSQPASGEGQQHEMPTHGEIHTIAGGFSGGGCTASQRKKYARSVMMVDMFEDHSPDVDITFTKEDLRDVVPHDNDPIVISLVTAGRKVHRVLVNQGSSADVMFWPTFTQLQLPLDQLRPYVLVWVRWRSGGGQGVHRAKNNVHE